MRLIRSQARHHRLQRRYRAALDGQVVVVLGEADRDDLSWNLADVATSRTDEDDLHAALLGELAHRGVGEDHGEAALHQLAAVLLEASGPVPVGTSRAGSSWTVTPWGQDDDADRDVLRAVLHALRPWADQVQTDLPLALREDWPPEVAAACDHLHAASPRHRGDDAGYATTGWLAADDDATWSAFVALAPYALGADVMDETARVVVDLSDQGSALALHLDAAQRAAVDAAMEGTGRGLRPLGRRSRRSRRAHPEVLDPAELVFVVAGDGVEHHATAREAAAHMEAIDVEDGEYSGVYGLDGTVHDVVVRRGLVELDRTERTDLPALLDALRDALDLPPGAPVDLVALVDDRQRRAWEHRWPRWPRRLDRRLHGDAPALLRVTGPSDDADGPDVREPGSR